jgi:hypothetical protein
MIVGDVVLLCVGLGRRKVGQDEEETEDEEMARFQHDGANCEKKCSSNMSKTHGTLNLSCQALRHSA